ncbi:DUF397 domain-containing protein [Saccharothrix violaceirubra]|uniref:DUF397 domain-containing protein n=1 Tax=Saccharothrix violaceirubra TaxID=413306 RepID=A0A7W7TA71_9PSEU|nr:DUF397 domain-containing protein [Saccharothrix violaceirubra]MBB4969388.1 hypothetical protein [Saccharothrix violaceirubra]
MSAHDTGWFRSSHSSAGSNTCVEVRFTDWSKSSHSSGGSNTCVEVRFAETAVGIRDSKNPTGPRLEVTGRAWAAFVGQLVST